MGSVKAGRLLVVLGLLGACLAAAAPSGLRGQKMKQAALPEDLGTRKLGADWPDFLGAARDGKSSEVGLGLPWPPEGPRVVWHCGLGEGFCACAVSHGRLFHFDRFGDKARLTCRKSETGQVLWKFEYSTEYRDTYGSGDGPRCQPVVDGERVYLFGPDGMLHCVAVLDGRLVWKKNTSEEFGVEPNFFGVGSTPLVEGELLIAQIGGSAPRGKDSGLVAMDKKTGQVRYAVTGELASYSSPVAATIEGRRWSFAFARGGLVAFEPSSGKVDFQYPWRARIRESVNICTPVVAGDLVFISEAYGVGSSVLRVRPGAYEVLWSDRRDRPPSMASYFDTPVHVDGFLYGSSGQSSGEAELRCVELSTGKVRWSRPDLTRCSLLYVDGHFVCLGEDGVLRLLKVSPERYQEVARAVLKSPSGEPLLSPPAWAAPVLSHGLLYLRGKDRLVCLELIPVR